MYSKKERKITVYSNETFRSDETSKLLKHKLEDSGFITTDQYCSDSELIICVGGDGAFLRTLHKLDFPDIPIVGVNTGHLGFFQDIMPERLDDFIFDYSQENYCIQELPIIMTQVKSEDTIYSHPSINEVVIKREAGRPVHLNLSIEGSFIERFSGDGILISSPVGSTAYNYSLRGSIVDPRLDLLQITPIAPMNTTAYRSFTSSILLPSHMSIEIIPDLDVQDQNIRIAFDGFNKMYKTVDDIKIEQSDRKVCLLRFKDYNFWNKVKSKLL